MPAARRLTTTGPRPATKVFTSSYPERQPTDDYRVDGPIGSA